MKVSHISIDHGFLKIIFIRLRGSKIIINCKPNLKFFTYILMKVSHISIDHEFLKIIFFRIDHISYDWEDPKSSLTTCK